jgi:AcrR family transcriptional regulator
VNAALTREARKEQTREAIIAAATKLFARQGIEATSLDRIAKEIGLTKGAIYSTFASKDDLVEAVATANAVSVGGDLLFDPDVPLREVLRSLALEVMAVRKKLTRDQFILYLELTLYERRHRSWGRRVLEENRAALAEDLPRFEEAMKKRRERLPMSIEEFFNALNAVAVGVVIALERDPDSLSKESVLALFESLAE